MGNFNVGDLVRLKNGSPDMVVVSTDIVTVGVAYFGDEEVNFEYVHEDLLSPKDGSDLLLNDSDGFAKHLSDFFLKREERRLWDDAQLCENENIETRKSEEKSEIVSKYSNMHQLVIDFGANSEIFDSLVDDIKNLMAGMYSRNMGICEDKKLYVNIIGNNTTSISPVNLDFLQAVGMDELPSNKRGILEYVGKKDGGGHIFGFFSFQIPRTEKFRGMLVKRGDFYDVIRDNNTFSQDYENISDIFGHGNGIFMNWWLFGRTETVMFPPDMEVERIP